MLGCETSQGSGCGNFEARFDLRQISVRTGLVGAQRFGPLRPLRRPMMGSNRMLRWDQCGPHQRQKLLQGGPPTSYKSSYNSTYRGYNPSYPFIRPFIGVITPFITNRGPPCGWWQLKYFWIFFSPRKLGKMNQPILTVRIFFKGVGEKPPTRLHWHEHNWRYTKNKWKDVEGTVVTFVEDH